MMRCDEAWYTVYNLEIGSFHRTQNKTVIFLLSNSDFPMITLLLIEEQFIMVFIGKIHFCECLWNQLSLLSLTAAINDC